MKKKKIIIFHHSDLWGGGSISLLIVALSLIKRYDVTVYLPHANTPLYQELERKKIHVKSVNDNIGIIDSFSGSPSTMSRAFFLCLFKIILCSYKRVSELVRMENPDIIIVNSMTLSWIGKIAKQYKKETVCFVRETASKAFGMKLIYFCLNHYFDGIAYLSEFDRKYFNGKAITQEVIPDTVFRDAYKKSFSKKEARRKLKIDEEGFYLLFTGGTNIHPKGWGILKNAISYVKGQGIKLLVTGNIVERENDESIIFMGSIMDMELLYFAADVLVFPSTAPHQARPAYEAGFAGRPVIITEYEQTREYVKDGYNGLTFREGDAKMLSQCILQLHQDNKLLNFLGENNYRETMKKHNPVACENQLFLFMNKVTEKMEGE